MKTIQIIIILAALILVGAACQKQSAVTNTANQTNTNTISNARGLSFSPQSLSAADMNAFFTYAPQGGEYLSWAGEWRDLVKASGSGAVLITTKAQEAGQTPIIVVGFSPEEILSEAQWSKVEAAVVDFVAKYRTPYLALGNEINKTFDQATVAKLAERFTGAQAAIKAVSPTTKVFPVWQLEWMTGNHGGLFGGRNSTAQAQWAELDLFPTRDMTVFTTYPGILYKNPSDIPTNFYNDISLHTGGPFGFTEVGWFRTGPTGWSSSAEEQAEFITTYREVSNSLKPVFSVWPFLYDPATDPPFDSLGLLPDDATTSPAWEEWLKE